MYNEQENKYRIMGDMERRHWDKRHFIFPMQHFLWKIKVTSTGTRKEEASLLQVRVAAGTETWPACSGPAAEIAGGVGGQLLSCASSSHQ